MSSQLSSSGQPAVTGPAALAADVPLEKQAVFVQTLAQWGNVRAAAQQVGVSRAHLYRMRRASVQFRQLWDAALVLARPQVEEVLADRALNGVQEVVYYHGEEVATRTRYDSRLLLAHLARLDRIAGSAGVHATVANFDAEVERLLDPPELYDWDEDDEDDENAWDDGRWADEDGEDAALEDADGEDEDGEAEEAEACGAEAQAGEQAGEDGAGESRALDDAPAAADALSAGGGRAGSGAAGFVALDSVSCVSNRRGHGSAGGDGAGRAGPDRAGAGGL